MPSIEDRWKHSLELSLSNQGFASHVDVEKIVGTKFYRVGVVSNEFEHMRPSERQEFMWRLVRGKLGPDVADRIMSIMTLTMDEAGDDAPIDKKRPRKR